MKKIYIIILLIIILFTYEQLMAVDKLTIVYTNSLNGYIDFCECKENPNGGLVKRATEIKKIRKEFKNVVLFETGDFFSYDPDPLLADYIIKTYKYINYDAMVMGDQEYIIGIDKFLSYRKELPFVLNNLLVKEGNEWNQPFDRFRMINKGNMKIGVIGTISIDSFRYAPSGIKSSIKIQNQINELKKDIATIKSRGANFIVLLSHSGYENDVELSKALKGIDVIIGGHSQTMIKNSKKEYNAIIVQAGTNGAHIGILEIAKDKGGISFKNTFRLPTNHQPADDGYVRKLIDEYGKKAKEEAKKYRFK